MTEINQTDASKEHFIYSILNPKSICTFGANNDLLNTMGSMQLRNIIYGGFKGPIFPIHPKLAEVQGLKAYKSVLDVPETPELAFIILPPKVVPQVMEECGEKGVKRMIITSGGFREIGSDGQKLSNTINEIAKKYDIRFIGPNCLGVHNGWYDPEVEKTHLNTMWIYNVPKRGNISVASQSGTVACHMYWHGNNMGVNIGKSISLGNENNIDIVDFLEFFKDDPQTSVIGLYIEEIKRGREFIKLAREITPYKPIIAIYAGGSEAAERSIMSHTGSIGGNQRIYDAVFKETGIIATDSILDFLYYLRTLSFSAIDNIYPKGNRIGIITDSGGAGSMMTKNCETLGLTVPEFSKPLQEKIRTLIPYTASPINPVDLTFDMNQYNLYVNMPKLLMKSGEVDGIIVYGIFDFHEVFTTMQESGVDVSEGAAMLEVLDRVFLKPLKRICKKESFPVFLVGPQLYSYPWYQKILEFNMNIFDFWDYPSKCMSVLAKYSDYRYKHNKNIK